MLNGTNEVGVQVSSFGRLGNGRLVSRHDDLKIALPSPRSHSTMEQKKNKSNRGTENTKNTVGVVIVTGQGYIMGVYMSPPSLNIT